MNKDVTAQVDFGFPDDEFLPLLKCICGEMFAHWEYCLSIDKDDLRECPTCGVELYFEFIVKVYQVIDEEEI